MLSLSSCLVCPNAQMIFRLAIWLNRARFRALVRSSSLAYLSALLKLGNNSKRNDAWSPFFSAGSNLRRSGHAWPSPLLLELSSSRSHRRHFTIFRHNHPPSGLKEVPMNDMSNLLSILKLMARLRTARQSLLLKQIQDGGMFRDALCLQKPVSHLFLLILTPVLWFKSSRGPSDTLNTLLTQLKS